MSEIRIARPALARRLTDALESGDLFLIAPAGFGKTLALEEALGERTGTVGRVRCTPADGDPGRLLDHLIRVLRAAAPGAADVVADKLALAFGPVDPDGAMAELISELEHLVVDPLTLFFDDAEHVADEAEAAHMIGSLLATSSPALRIAVASRRPLPLRLAKLRAAGRLTVLGPGELAFTASECEEVLRLARGGDVRDDTVRETMEISEGWPLGVALTARQDDADSPVPHRPAAELWEYLTEEVLDGIDPCFRRDLLKSSLPPELSEGLAAALGLDPSFLDAAEHQHRFLHPLHATDGERLVAYHPLFREFLLNRLTEELSKSEIRELHARLAAEIADARPLEAVEHWLAAGREAEAMKLIGRHSQPLVRSSPGVVREWIGRLSASGRTEPAIKLIEGQLAMGDGRPGDAAPLLRAAAEEWASRRSRASWTARFALAQTYIVLGRVDEVRLLAEGLEAPEAADAVAAPMVAIMAALATGASGRRAEGAALVERALAHPLGRLVQPYTPAFQAYYVDWHAGRLDAALEGAQRATAPLEELDPMRWLPYMLWYTGYIQEARGDDAAAVALLQRSREEARRYGLGEYPAAVATALKAGCDARAGRIADAELELARATPHLGGTWFSYDVELTRAELAARAGEARAVVGAAERALTIVEHGYLGERLRAATLLAPLLAGVGATARAQAAVETALAARPKHARTPRLVALRAWLRDLQGEEGCVEELGGAWRQAGDQVRYLVRGEWPRVEPLVWAAVEHGELDATDVVTALKDAFPEGERLVGLVDHPAAAVRRAAAPLVATSGHPDTAAKLAALTRDEDPGVVEVAQRVALRLRNDPPPLTFRLFGAFALKRGGREVLEQEWERRVAVRLVRFLLVNREAAVGEDQLFDAFWPGRTTQPARRSLQVAVSAARAVLDPPGAVASVIEARERSYRLVLNADDVVDTDVFARAARAALADEAAARRHALGAAVALWGGEPLPEERYEDWATAWREHLVDLQGELLTSLAQACFAAGDHFAAAAAGHQLVELDPLNESAHRTLMVAYARTGRRGHALRQFLDCRRTLIDALGVEPADQTIALQRSILGGEPV